MKKKLNLLLVFIAGIQFGLLAQTGIACKNCVYAKSEIIKDTTPQRRIQINGKQGGWIDNCELKFWDSIVVTPPATDHNGLPYNVQFYQCIVQNKKGAKVFTAFSSKLNSDLIDCISQCSEKDLIIFFNFKLCREGLPAKSIDSGPVFRMQKQL